MKLNHKPQDIEEMTFKRLTIVYNKPDAEKSFSPVNPEAVLVAVKSAEDKSGIAKAFDALKSVVLGQGPHDTPILDAIAKKDAEDGDGGTDDSTSNADTGSDAVEDAQDNGVASALMNAAYEHADVMSRIISTPGFTKKQKKDAIVKHVADHAVRTSALASEYFGGKAMQEGEAVKAGAVHSAATIEQLAQTHQHLADSHAASAQALKKMQAAHDATGKAIEHTGKLLGKNDSVDHTDKPVAEGAAAGTSADSATKSVEDDMTKEDIDALVAGISAGVGSAVKAAIAEAMPKPVEGAVLAPLVAPLDADAVKALLSEQQVAMEAKITAAVTTATEAASKSAQEAAKSELDKLTDAAEKASAEAVAKTVEAEKARELLNAAVKASRDRQAPGGHQDEMEASKAGGKAVKEKSSAQLVKDSGAKTIDAAISAILRPNPQ